MRAFFCTSLSSIFIVALTYFILAKNISKGMKLDLGNGKHVFIKFLLKSKSRILKAFQVKKASFFICHGTWKFSDGDNLFQLEAQRML